MSFTITNIEEFDKLINNREYVEELELATNDDINNKIQYLSNLKKLVFTVNFNTKIDLSKLTNLTHLEFQQSSDFNQELDLTNNTNLLYLKFGYYFSQQIDLSRLTNLTSLFFGFYYKHSNDLSIHTNLKFLHIGYAGNFGNTDFSQLTNLTKLQVCQKNPILLNISNLSNLTYFEFYNYCNQFEIKFSSLINLQYLKLVVIGCDIFQIDLSKNINLKKIVTTRNTEKMLILPKHQFSMLVC